MGAQVRKLPFKDQPVDLEEFEVLWDMIGDCYFDLYNELSSGEEYAAATVKLKEIKHRFFNEVLR